MRTRPLDLPPGVGPVLIVSGVFFFGWIIPPFLVLMMTAELGFEATAAAIHLSVHGSGAVAGSLVSGWLLRHVSPRACVLASLATTAALALAFSAFLQVASTGTDDVCALVGSGTLLFTMSAAATAFRPAVAAQIAALAAPSERARVYALYVVVINSGAGCGVIVAGLLFAIAPSAIVLVHATAAFAALVAAWTLWPRRKARIDGPSEISERAADKRAIALLFVALFVVEALAKQDVSTLPLFAVSDLGASAQGWSGLVSLSHWIFVALVAPLAWVTKRLAPATTATVGTVIVAAGFAGFAVSSSLPHLYPAFIILVIGELLFYPAMVALVMNHAGREAGSVMGRYHALQTIAGLLAPAASVLLYDAFGAVSLWFGSAVLGLVAAGLIATKTEQYASLVRTLKRVER